MPDLLVRDIDPEVYKRMKKAAEAQGKSLAQATADEGVAAAARKAKIKVRRL